MVRNNNVMNRYGVIEGPIILLRISKILKWSAFVLPFFVLLGWQLDNDLLKRLYIGSIQMNPLTAVLLILSAITITHENKIKKSYSIFLPFTYILIAIASTIRLYDFFYPLPYRIDHLFFGDFLAIGNDRIYSMAPTTAFLFILLGFAQLAKYFKWLLVSEVLLIALIIVTLFMVTGYGFNVPEFHSTIPLFSAQHTCLLFLFIASSILLSQINRGLVSLLVVNLEGARVGRLLIPLVVIVPFVIGYFRLLYHRSGISSLEMGISVVVFCYVLIFSTILFIMVYYLNKRDQLRHKLMSKINIMNADLSESNSHQLALNEELTASNEEIHASNDNLHAMNEKLKEAKDTIERQTTIIIEQKERALLQSKEHLDIIFSNTNEGILLLNTEGILIAFNNSSAKFILMATGTMPKIGMYIWDITVSERSHEAKSLFQLAKGGQVMVQQVLFNTPKGLFANVLKYEPVLIDGKVMYVTVISRDITEQERATEKLKQSFDELKKTNYELDRFVYSASHDLRAPLSSILGLINVAEMENKGIELPFLNMIRGRINHLDGFIKGILDYSRNARTEADYQKINFEKLLSESTASLRLVSRYEELTIKIKIENNTSFYSDPLRLSVIFNNLLSNSIKFKDDSKTQSTVSITIFVDGQNAHIEIQDNGIGIDDKHVLKIFDMFYRASERSDGAGIGLYIVNETILKLKGSIAVESELGKFTRFNIILPNEIQRANTKNEQLSRMIEQSTDESSLLSKND
jgi:PAS domain S-box-containing protein